jgi:hypothetical protein
MEWRLLRGFFPSAKSDIVEKGMKTQLKRLDQQVMVVTGASSGIG